MTLSAEYRNPVLEDAWNLAKEQMSVMLNVRNQCLRFPQPTPGSSVAPSGVTRTNGPLPSADRDYPATTPH
jgi:hypothetical protein